MRSRLRRGEGLVGMLVVIALVALLISILLPALARARQQAKKAYCANNLGQFGRALHIYAGEYRFFCPHSPYPTYRPAGRLGEDAVRREAAYDPNVGWLMAYAMRLAPPARYSNGHFQWYVLGEDEVPDILVCPAANRDLMFIPNPELSRCSPWESFVCQYAAFYQCSGTIRSATPVQQPQTATAPGVGGRNPSIPDPTQGLASGQRSDNSAGPVPYVRVAQHKSQAADVSAGSDQFECWIQAVDPSEIDNPGRLYYMADSREYRPAPGSWPAGTTNDGWYSGEGNKVYLGTRHRGMANVSYVDGHVSSDNLAHMPQWAIASPVTGWDDAQEWRCSTFADAVRVADIGTGHHVMPVLNVRGWESAFAGR